MSDTQADYDRTIAEEGELTVAGFSLDDSWAVGSRIVELAKSRGLGVAVDIQRGDQQVFHAALAGTSANNDLWMQRKVRTTRLLGISSLAARFRSELRPTAFESLDRTQYALAGGCVPVKLADGSLIATVTVSGLADTEDHALVVEALKAQLRA